MKNLLLTFVLLMGVVGMQAQNLLADPGFEAGSPGLPIAAPGDWIVAEGPNAYFEPSQAPLDPSREMFNGKMFGGFTGGFNQVLTLQVLPANPGDQYDASVEMLHSSNDALGGGNQAFMLMSFQDGGGAPLLEAQSPLVTNATPQDIWQTFNVSEVAPAGTVQVKYCVFFQQLDGTSGGSVFFDNTSLRNITAEQAAIPTMGQWALLILGLIMTSLGVVYIGRRSIA